MWASAGQVSLFFSRTRVPQALGVHSTPVWVRSTKHTERSDRSIFETKCDAIQDSTKHRTQRAGRRPSNGPRHFGTAELTLRLQFRRGCGIGKLKSWTSKD